MEGLTFSEFTKRIYIKAPMERIYDLWATPNGICSWFLRDAVYICGKGKTRSGSEQIAAGDFGPLLGWLRANVHGQGRLKSAVQLMRDVTGAELSTEPFKAHLRARYLAD